MYRVSNFLKSFSFVLVVVFVASMATQVKGTPPNTVQQFEQKLNLFELKMNKVMDAYGAVDAALLSSRNSNFTSAKMDKLEREVDRVGGILIGLQVKGNGLNNAEITMGLGEIANSINALRCACNSALAAAAAGNLSQQQMTPIVSNITDIFRVINDCLRREIQIIRDNS